MVDRLPPSIAGSASLINARTDFDPTTNIINGPIYARILSVNWAARTIECVGLHRSHGMGTFRNVPVLASVFTQTEGLNWLPDIAEPSGSSPQSNAKLEGEDDALAVIMFLNNNQDSPVCVGFIAPGYNQFSFIEEGTKIDRHTSDIYNRITKDGTYELSFPDGTYVKIGPPSNGYDLTDLSKIPQRDKKTHPWFIPPDGPRIIIVKHVSGTSISISEGGAVTVYSAGSVSVTADGGAVEVNSSANVNVNAAAGVNINAASGVNVTSPNIGVSGSNVNVSGSNVNVSGAGGSVVVSGVSLTTHTHAYSWDGEGGSSRTSGPGG